MKPHRFVQARRPRVATEVARRKSARPGVFPADEKTSTPTTASCYDLTIEVEFATNSIASGANSISARARFGNKPQATNEAKWSATA
jgi:hypothetical protein